jgi:hypothetical protein
VFAIAASKAVYSCFIVAYPRTESCESFVSATPSPDAKPLKNNNLIGKRHITKCQLGTQRLRQEMQSKGMDPQAVAQAVALLRTSEQARALEVCRKKFGSPAATPAERAKQVRFLAGRGFSGEAIARVVSGAFDADEG